MLSNKIKDIFLLIKSNKLDIAEKASLDILKDNHGNIDILNVLAIIYERKKNYSKAIPILKNILLLNSEFTDALINLGNIYKDLRNYDQSIFYYKKCIKLQPNSFFAFFELAKTLDLNGQYFDAQKIYISLLQKNKNNKDLLSEYCKNQIFLKNLKESERVLSILEKENFSTFDICLLKSLVEIKKENYSLAEVYINKAKLIKPYSHKVYLDLGSIKAVSGDHKNAIIDFKKSISLYDDHNAKYNLSLSSLSINNFEQGWKYYFFRTARFLFINSVDNKSIWDGEESNKTIIVHGEQGIGDEILFSSMFYNLIKDQKKIIVTCDKRLLKIFNRSFKNIKFFSRNNDFNYDVEKEVKHISSGDLGQYFRKKTSDFNLPNWLKADTILVEKYSKLLNKNKKIKIGLGWTSFQQRENVSHKERVVSLEKIVKIFPQESFDLINLQYGEIAEDLKRLKENHNRNLILFDKINYKNDLDDLAAIMTNCDLVVSIASFTSSFAGSLGVKTLALVPTNFGWSWSCLDNNQSTWFPSVKIIRQNNIGNWDDVLTNLKKEVNILF